MAVPKSAVRATLLLGTLVLALAKGAEKATSGKHEEPWAEVPDTEEPGGDEEEEDEVLAKIDGVNISLCILGIMTALIAVTCVFENIKDAIYEGTEKASLPIVDALFSEMTVLGFLSMVTFIVASAGFLTDISKVVFGETEKGEGYLKELFEQAHYMLFLVMVVFFFIAIYILAINNATMARLHDLRDRVLRPEWFSSQFDIASQPRPSWWCGGAKRREHNDACDFLEYMSMRREFIHGRKGELPHGQLPLKDWLPLDYNYAKYLSIKLGQTIAKTIDVDSWTWLQLWVFNICFYLFTLAYPPKGPEAIVACSAWVALGYLEAWFIVCFYHKVREVRWCMCCEAEVPHVQFGVKNAARGLPSAALRTDFSKQRRAQPSPPTKKNRLSGYEPIPDADLGASQHSHYEVSSQMRKMNSGASFSESPPKTMATFDRGPNSAPHMHSAAAQKEIELVDAPAKELELRERAPPPWANIVVDLASRSRFQQWLGGRAPFRMMYMYWNEGNGPDLHIAILRLHLVYLSIQITLLVLVFAPLIKEHFGGHAYALYLAAPLPHLAYTVGSVLGPLTRIVTEIGCVGVLADPKVKKEVLRMMKTEKSVKGLMLLTGMKHFISDNRKKRRKKQGAKAGGVEEEKEEKRDEGFLEGVARELFDTKFDTQAEGFVEQADFSVGLALMATFSDAEAAMAFQMADVGGERGKVDLLDFTLFFKRLSHPTAWKQSYAGRGMELSVAARLNEAFAKRVEAKTDKAAGVGLSAEEELAVLHREHGRAVHELVMLFDQHDTSGDGALQADEVRAMIGALGEDLTEAEARQLVNHLDRDGDGEVSMAEFVIWAFKRQESTEDLDVEELAGEIFDVVFDATSDGQIDVNEFIVGLEKCKSDLSYDEKHDLFREADENGGGFIDREEFVKLMTKYSE